MRRASIDYGIIGIGKFGFSLAKTLAEAGEEVLVLDKSDIKIQSIRNYVQEAFVTEDLSKEALKDTGIQNCQTVIICTGDRIDVSVMTTYNVIDLGVPRVIAYAISREHGVILEKIGAETVFPEQDTALRLASVLLESESIDIMQLNDDFVISEIRITDQLEGKHINDLQCEKYKVKIVAIERQYDTTETDFVKDTVLHTGDAIVLIGKFVDVDKFEEKLSSL